MLVFIMTHSHVRSTYEPTNTTFQTSPTTQGGTRPWAEVCGPALTPGLLQPGVQVYIFSAAALLAFHMLSVSVCMCACALVCVFMCVYVCVRAHECTHACACTFVCTCALTVFTTSYTVHWAHRLL